MDATIVAALISGGVGALGIAGTVVTSVVGARNTRKATEQAIAAGAANTTATLAAAREDRLWEKRAAAYEESLTELLFNQASREYDLRKYRLDKESEQRLKGFYDGYELPAVFESSGRLVAYASDAVVKASSAASRAHSDVRTCNSRVEMFREQIRTAQAKGTPQSAPDGDAIMDAQRQLDDAVEAAVKADQAVIYIIRNELRSRPEAALQPVTAPPAVRRRFWLRHRG